MRVWRRSCSVHFVGRMPRTYSSVPSGVPRTRRPWRSPGRDQSQCTHVREVPADRRPAVPGCARELQRHVGKNGLARSQLRVNGCEGWVLRDGVQSGHERVALLAAFRLPNLVRLRVGVLPNVCAVGGVELAHVRQQRLQAGSLPEARKHRVARHMIKCADCVDGQHGCTRVASGGNTE